MKILNPLIFLAATLFVVAVECGKSFSCPYLIRANKNWEIEKFFGTWHAIESFTHAANENIKVEDTCASLKINEVSEETHEAVTFGRPVDPYNYRLALRHLKVELIGGSRVIEYFLTFNNTNPMHWKNDEAGISMQIIKFDSYKNRTSMMLTVCIESEELFYSTLFDRNEFTNVESKNHLLFNALKQKIYSSFSCTQLKTTMMENSTSKLNLSSLLMILMLAFKRIIQ